jgi:DNA polymerase-3 subunit epsilon
MGHNVTFDWNFLRFEFARVGITLPAHDSICAMGLAQVLDTSTPNFKLDSLAFHCDVPLPRATFHDAREVVRAAAGTFARLYPLALTHGINVTKHLDPVVWPHVHKGAPCNLVKSGQVVAGRPLAQGMHFAITGDTRTPPEELVARAGTAGLNFTSHSVSAKTSFVIANDQGSGSSTVE